MRDRPIPSGSFWHRLVNKPENCLVIAADVASGQVFARCCRFVNHETIKTIEAHACKRSHWTMHLLKKLRRTRSAYPLDPLRSDVYLAEFPKSGITWLSTVLANVAMLESGMKGQASFGSVQDTIPDLHMVKLVGPALYSHPPCRMLKTHSRFDYRYLRNIYLVRHPFPVLKSYYNYLTSYKSAFAGTFEHFVASEKYGASAWQRHVSSWLCRKPRQERVLVVRYEDMISDMDAVIHRISNGFGWDFDPANVAIAIERSGVRQMQESEAFFRDHQAVHRGGFVKQPFRGAVTQAAVDMINGECAAELEMLDYRPAELSEG